MDLQEYLQDGLVWLVTTLDPVVERRCYAMGGDSVLASLWDHRHNMGIDLLYDHDTSDDVNMNRLQQYMGELELSGHISNLQLHSTFGLTAEGPHMPFSFLYTRRAFNEDALGEQEKHTGINTENPAEILARKIRSGMIYQPEFAARDAFDVIVGCERDPQSLRQALDALINYERRLLRYAAESELIDIRQEEIDYLKTTPRYENLCQKELLEQCLKAIFIDDVEARSMIQKLIGTSS